jgi:hypothetical protein
MWQEEKTSELESALGWLVICSDKGAGVKCAMGGRVHTVQLPVRYRQCHIICS